MPSTVSSSTNLRFSSASLFPYHFSRPAALTFKSLISMNLTCGTRTKVSHLPLISVKHLLIPATLTDDCRAFQTLLEACHTLRVLNFNFTFSPGITQLLGSIPSSSVSLIRVSNPLRIGGAPMTYSNSWPWKVSIRKIAQRYSDRHSGLKTRVRATLDLSESEIQAVENGEKPFYKTRLEEELGDHVDLELILVVLPEPEPYESDTDG